MKNLIITISREYGSGGSAIGKYVAERLEIPFYDREKIDLLAHEKGLDKLYIKNWQGQPPTSVIWDNADNPLAAFYYNDKNMFKIQSGIICELAAQSSCIIIGRCADYILRDKATCLNIMIYADKESKLTRLYDEYWIRNGDLAKQLKDTDKIRSIYYTWFTGRSWGEPKNYHMLLKSDMFGLDGCTDIIVDAVKRKWSRDL